MNLEKIPIQLMKETKSNYSCPLFPPLALFLEVTQLALRTIFRLTLSFAHIPTPNLITKTSSFCPSHSNKCPHSFPSLLCYLLELDQITVTIMPKTPVKSADAGSPKRGALTTDDHVRFLWAAIQTKEENFTVSDISDPVAS